MIPSLTDINGRKASLERPPNRHCEKRREIPCLYILYFLPSVSMSHNFTSRSDCSSAFGHIGVLAGLLLIHLGLTAFLTVRYAPTLDETAHLPAGLAVWRFGRTDLYRVNPPLVRTIAALPVFFTSHQEDWSHAVSGTSRRNEWEVGADFVVANGRAAPGLYALARWMCLPFSLLGLLVCWFWGRELAGSAGGTIAAALWCFSPNLIGHGALITNDVAAAACGLLAAWRFQHWLLIPSGKNAFVSGTCLGLALLTKTYWIILLGIWPLLTGLTWFVSSREKISDNMNCDQAGWKQPHMPGWRSMFAQLLLILLIGLNLLNLGYGFRGTGTRLADFPFYSRALSGTHRDLELDEPGNRFKNIWYGQVPIPLPRDYVTGIDLQKHDFERPRINYLLGQYRRTGWWYYYLVGLGVKVPLGTWMLVGLGLWTGCWVAGFQRRFFQLLPLWFPALILFCIVSAETGMNRHVRYVFPVLPLLYLVAAQAALIKTRWWLFFPLAATIVASLAAFPGSLSFFNWAARGFSPETMVLIDSNLDWGQDLLQARTWIEAHPECRPVTIAAVTGFPVEAIGIDLPFTPGVNPPVGWHLISVHLLQATKNSYSSFRKLEPVGRVGSTFNIYHVPDTIKYEASD